MNRSFRLAAVAFVALFVIPAGKSLGQNVTYTYTVPYTSGTVDWSTGTNWAGSTAPVSSATTALIFTGSMSASEAFLSNNNTSGTFGLNYLQFSGSGGNSLTMLTISGNPLSFSGSAARISVASGTAGGTTTRPSWTISNNIIINTSALSLQNAQTTSSAYLTGTISGTGGLYKDSGTGGVTISGTSNTFSGPVLITANGSLSANTFGTAAGAASSLGTSGTITLGSSSNAGTLNWVGSGTETTNKVFVMAGTTGGATIYTGGTAGSLLAITSDLWITGTGNKTLTLGASTSMSFSGLIGAGPGSSVISFAKSGTGTVTLSGTANAFTGSVSVNGGTLEAARIGAAAGSVGSLGTSGTISLGSGATAASLNWIGSGTETTSKVFAMAGTTGGATITSATAGQLLSISSDLLVSGSGNKTLTLGGAGNLTFSGAIADGSGAAAGSVITLAKTGAGTVTLTGTNTYTGNITASGGSLVGTTSSLRNNITLSNSAGVAFDQTSTGSYTGVISGTGSLTKAGVGSVTLTNANTFNGATTVSGGTLALSSAGSVGSSAFNVGSGATYDVSAVTGGLSLTSSKTLSGAGTVLGAVSISGTVNPGDSGGIGVLTTGATTLNGGGVLNIQMGNASLAAGTGWDLLSTGALTFANSSGSRFVINLSGSASNFDSSNDKVFKILGATSIASGSFNAAAFTFNNTLTGYNGGNFTLTSAGSDINITYTAAQVLNWLNGTGGDGSWTATGGTNWSGGAWNPAKTAAFAGTPGTVTVDAAGVSANKGLQFDVAGYTVAGGTISLGGADSATNSFTASNGTTTINSVLAGTAGFTKSGTGTLALGGANTVTGAVNVSVGTLSTTGADVLADTAAVTVQNAATFALGGGDAIGSLAGAGSVTLGSNTLTTGGDNTSTTFSGAIAGTGGLTKSGTGTFILTGSNGYSGATAVNGGSLQIGSSGTVGSIASTSGISLGSGGSLVFARTDNQGGSVGTLITGSGAVALASGTLQLTNASNSFSGGLNVQQGVLNTTAVGNNGSNGVLGSGGTITLGSGTTAATFNLTSSGTETTNRAFALGGSTGGATITASTTSTQLTITSDLTAPNAGNKTLTLGGSGVVALNGVVPAGSGGSVISVVKTGAGSAYLNSDFNTFTGGVSVNQGTLYVDKIGMTGSSSSLGTSGTVSLGSTINSGALRSIGASETSDKVIALAGTTGGATIYAGAASAITMSGNIVVTGSGNKTLTLTGITGATLSVGGLITDGTGPQAGSVISVTAYANQSPKIILANTGNTFSGPMTITQVTSGQTTTLSTAMIGMSGSASPLGTNGTIKIGGALGTSTLQYTGSGETTDKVIDLYQTVGSVNIDQQGSGLLRIAGNITATGAGSKTLTLTGSAYGSAGEISGIISNNSGGNVTTVRKLGNNMLWTLSGANTYTGNTIVSQGQLAFTSGALATSSTIQMTGGELRWATGNTDDISSRLQIGTGSAAMTGYIDTGANNVTFASNITDSGTWAATLSKANGTGTLSLRGTNTYSGGTRILFGTVNFASAANLGTGTITLGSGTTATSGTAVGYGTLQWQTGNTADISNRLTFKDANVGTLDANGNNVTFANAIGGTTSGALNKIGAGTLTLSAANLYTGDTTVTGGGLVVNGSLQSPNVTVAAGASLGGSGTLAGTLTGAGLVGPGNSPGILTAAAVNPSAGLGFAFEFTGANPNYASPSGSLNDVLWLTGGTPFTSNLTGANEVDIYFTQAAVELGTLTGGFFTANVADFLSSISGANFQYFVQSNSGSYSYGGSSYQTLAQFDAGKSVTISTVAANGGQVMQMVVVPEPSAMVVAGIGIAVAGWRLLRRRGTTLAATSCDG